MADYNSGLPIRTQADGTDERVHVKVVDYTSPGGAGQQLAVTADGEAKVQVQGDNPGGGVEILRLSELGAPNGDGFYHATNNSKPDSSGVIGHTRAATPADTDQVKRVTAKTGTVDTDVHALDISLHDEDGNKYSESNPLPVFQVEGEGTEVWDYNTSSAVAAAASVNHDYAPSGVDLKVSKIYISGSGKLKVEVQVETAVASGVYNTYFVGFNSTANPNIEYDIKPALFVLDGVNIRVKITNRDNQAQDLYSTVVGYES
jgi:hypothetical protein